MWCCGLSVWCSVSVCSDDGFCSSECRLVWWVNVCVFIIEKNVWNYVWMLFSWLCVCVCLVSVCVCVW